MTFDEAAKKIANLIVDKGLYGMHDMHEFAKAIGWSFPEGESVSHPNSDGWYTVTVNVNSPNAMAKSVALLLSSMCERVEKTRRFVIVRDSRLP